MFNFGFDPEKYASLGSSFDEPDPFAPVQPAALVKPSAAPIAPSAKQTYKAGDVETIFGDAGEKIGTNTYYDQKVYDSSGKVISSTATPREALWSADRVTYENKAANPDFDIVNFYKDARTAADKNITAKEVRKVLTRFDPNRGELMGTTPSGYLLDQQVGRPFIEAIRDNKLSLTQKTASPLELDYKYDYDANNLYMKQPAVMGNTDLQQGFTDKERDTYRDLMKRGSFIDVSGGTSDVGEYTMAWVEDPPKPSGFSKFLNNPIMSIIGALVPPIGVATTAAKAATGETLHAGDWLSMATVGLNKTGMLKAPASAEEARKIGELASQTGNVASGMVAKQLALSGVGLGPLTYSQSTALLNAAATGDPKSFIYSTVGNAAIDKVFAEATGTVKGMSDTGRVAGIFQSDDAKAGLLKVVDKLSSGADFDKALIYGLGTYIKEGGGLNIPTPDGLGFDLPSVDLGILEDVAKSVGNVLSDADTAVRKGLKEFDKTIQPVTKEIGRGLSAADTLARQGLSAFDDAVIQPTGEFLSAADTAARRELTKLDEGLYDIQSPFSTPEIDLPNFNLPSLGMGMGMLLSSASAPTATTGKIFEDELFKFKNKIELTEFGPLNQPEQEVDIEEFLTSPFESAFTTSQRFA